MKVLNNASITRKSPLLTLVSGLFLLGITGLAISSLIEIRQTNDTVRAASELRAQARSAWVDLARGQAAL